MIRGAASPAGRRRPRAEALAERAVLDHNAQTRMAELRIDGDDLVLHLTPAEKLEGVHADLRAPRSSVRSVEVLDNAHEPADHGFKVGGRLPGVFEVASIASGGQRLFAAVHHNTPRGVRIVFQGADYDAWIVGCADPESVRRQIE